jgi:hypothetical protein
MNLSMMVAASVAISRSRMSAPARAFAAASASSAIVDSTPPEGAQFYEPAHQQLLFPGCLSRTPEI